MLFGFPFVEDIVFNIYCYVLLFSDLGNMCICPQLSAMFFRWKFHSSIQTVADLEINSIGVTLTRTSGSLLIYKVLYAISTIILVGLVRSHRGHDPNDSTLDPPLH